ncbi:MAG: YlxM family DNA-binding protein [Clostridia bacterium]
MAKNLEVAMLLDFYGEMLTQKQRDFISYYYDDDLSLAEIAENENITRQGVRDAIKRAETQLFDMEEHLGLAKRFEQLRAGLDEIIECAQKIGSLNMEFGLSRDINDASLRIQEIAQSLRE